MAKQILEEYSEEPESGSIKKDLSKAKKKAHSKQEEKKTHPTSLAEQFVDLDNYTPLEALPVENEDQDNFNHQTAKKRSLTQILNEQEKLKKNKKTKLYKGDEDLPIHDPMVIRDSYTRNFSQFDEEEEYEDTREERRRKEEEELSYLDPITRSVHQLKKKQRGYVAVPGPVKVINEGEKRKADRNIKKNKGLTAKRKKEDKNPRLKLKRKYNEALKKQRSAGLKSYNPPLKPYAGTPGIKTNLSRSTKLG